MKKVLTGIIGISFLWACGGPDAPDVSDINVDLQTQHFEKDFFAIDTNQVVASLYHLENEYPFFLQAYIQHILGLPPVTDTSEGAQIALKSFIRDYTLVKDSADKIFKDFFPIQQEIRQGLQFVKYYFPHYKLPSKVITFIGPLDGYGDVIIPDALAVGLQAHMGKDFPLYHTSEGESMYPVYISRRFTPATIPVNCMRNIIDDLYPDKSATLPLVLQMVEQGKRQYLLDKLLPYTADSLKIGYTSNQLKGCYDNEGLIWNFFLTNNLVYNTDPMMIKNFIGERPNTPEVGEGSPGNIGAFVGWQIVQKYMDIHDTTTLDQLMQADPKLVFEESKYKPK